MAHPAHGQNREEQQGATSKAATTAGAEELGADRLAEAERSGTPCRPVREILDGNDLATGYRVQSILTARSVAAGRRGSESPTNLGVRCCPALIHQARAASLS